MIDFIIAHSDLLWFYAFFYVCMAVVISIDANTTPPATGFIGSIIVGLIMAWIWPMLVVMWIFKALFKASRGY